VRGNAPTDSHRCGVTIPAHPSVAIGAAGFYKNLKILATQLFSKSYKE